MSSKTRFPPKPKKSKAGSKKTLESADDFQQAADAEEETGGKWRAGDKAKSCRAFVRAIELYDQGLSRHPRNFDLAYNKARLQFEVSEQPGLVACLSISLNEFLQQALQSHRYALRLNEENTDVLFNTSQLLVSLAENIVEDADPWELDQSVPAGLLHEALELLDACFTRQNMQFEEQQQAWNQETDEASGGVSLSNSAPSSPRSVTEQSATVESSVVPEDLLDTLRASITALTQLVTLDTSSAILTLSAMAESLLTTKFPYCTSLLPPNSQPSAQQETLLQRTSFTAALSSAEFDATLITPQTYLARLSFPTLDLATNSEAICTAADAISEAVSAVVVRLRRTPNSSITASDLVSILGQAQSLYSVALGLLSTSAPAKKGLQLSLVPRVDPETSLRLAAAHEAVADAALLELVLARMTGGNERGQLAKARGGYGTARAAYAAAEDGRAAGKVGARKGVVEVVEAVGMGDEAGVRQVVEGWKGREKMIRGVVREMWDEGLLWEWWEEVLECGIGGK
ncbi:hypothetical protein K461DRAFT_309251 [Myriangium duriaei CBS 260.36]|uniref:Uncharacterized protein n=1 Tax=Myriangium duriaei CBS 260.36 TaxID=1168546 RepID=A0A9P4J820_9PEZI|nr:hypothetical protein K461DRAFT_309251 [Myriangium duriaei CBS 260.36]